MKQIAEVKNMDQFKGDVRRLNRDRNRKQIFVDAVKRGANQLDKTRRLNRAAVAIRIAVDTSEASIPENIEPAATRLLELVYRSRTLPNL